MTTYTFDTILGNQNAINKLKTSIKQQQIPHALIFTGEEGMGKKLLAGTFAKTLLCENRTTDISPCHQCVSCSTFESMNHPDMIWVEKEKTTLGVGDVREQIVSAMETRPYSSEYKVFIIDEAESMTPQAQNALLKTIEEPANFGVFLFLATHDQNFLPTIISRCVMLKMHPVGDVDLKEKLVNDYKINEETARDIAGYSNGNIGKAIAYAKDDSFLSMKETVIGEIKELIGSNDLVKALQMADTLDPYKGSLNEVFDILVHYFRDTLVSLPKDDTNSFMYYTNAIENIWLAKKQLEQNGNQNLVLDHLFLSFLQT